MTLDLDGRQGIIDFEAFVAASKRRRKLRPSECVPKERVKVLADTRLVCGITLKEIADVSDLSVNFLSKVLTGDQDISLDEFRRLKDALFDVVIEKLLTAAGKR